MFYYLDNQVDRQPLIRLSKCLSNFRHFRKTPSETTSAPCFHTTQILELFCNLLCGKQNHAPNFHSFSNVISITRKHTKTHRDLHILVTLTLFVRVRILLRLPPEKQLFFGKAAFFLSSSVGIYFWDKEQRSSDSKRLVFQRKQAFWFMSCKIRQHRSNLARKEILRGVGISSNCTRCAPFSISASSTVPSPNIRCRTR